MERGGKRRMPFKKGRWPASCACFRTSHAAARMRPCTIEQKNVPIQYLADVQRHAAGVGHRLEKVLEQLRLVAPYALGGQLGVKRQVRPARQVLEWWWWVARGVHVVLGGVALRTSRRGGVIQQAPLRSRGLRLRRRCSGV